MNEVGNSSSGLLAVKEVAERLNVSPRTIQRLVKAGKLRAYRVGGQLRIPEAALKEMMLGVTFADSDFQPWKKNDALF
mgnify:CR=1 FL=1